ncbi:MAG: tail fiber domain-containing protein [Bdellovibrionaceae bacterium]|nr:tail fiber domain-containing protein [Pseudobdellovibrionaceae bacterium]
MKILVLFVLLCFLSFRTLAGNPGVSYQGRIIKPDGSPLEGSNVQFRMQVRSPGSENCLLYEEIQSVNMLGSSGVFSVTLNDGSGTRLDSPFYQIDRIFANRDTMTLDSTRCAVGTTYSPNSGDGRKFIVYFKDETMTAYEPLPIMSLNYTSQSMYALEAQKVDKFSASHLLRAVDGSGNPATVSALDPTQLTNLTNLLAGTSSQYATATQFNTVQSFAKVTLPTCAAGDVLKSDGSSLSCVTGSTSPGAITNTEISGSAAIADSKLATIATAGKVSGSAITSGTISGSTIINTSGHIQTSGAVVLYDAGPTNAVSIKAPASVSANYNLILPAAKPASNGLLLSGDTTGNLTWVTPSAGSVTGVTATAPLVSSGGTTPNISLAQSNTTTSGYISSGDWNTFNNKLSSALTSGHLLVGNGSNVAAGVTPSGDVSMTNLGAFTVSRIRSTTVSATTPTSAGQILRFDGSQWAPNFVSMFDLRSTITGAATFASGCTSGQTLTWTAATDNLSCTNIAITGAQVSGNITGNAANVTGVVAAANGGTGQSSYAIGDLLYASSTNVLSRLPASTSGYILTSNGAGTAPSWQAAAGGSSQWTTSGGNIYYNSGNVGIGTATPTQKLDISGGIKATSMQIGSTVYQSSGELNAGAGSYVDPHYGYLYDAKFGGPSGGIAVAGRSYFAGDVGIGTPTPGGRLAIVGAGQTSATYGLNITDSLGGSKFFVRDDGNVGIGTANPSAKLSVKGASGTAINLYGSTDQVSVSLLSSSDYGSLVLKDASNVDRVKLHSWGAAGSGFYYSATSGLSDGNATTFANAMTVNVPNTLGFENGIGFTNGGEGNALGGAITWYVADTSYHARGGLRFKTNSVGAGNLTTRMTISETGQVGIGTNSPQTTLQVAGVISPATNNNYSLGNATYRFTEVYATNGVINTSDRREKKDIYDTNLGLEFINKLRPVSYRWNTGVDEDIHYGLIAQEAEQAILEASKDNQKTSIVTHDVTTDKYGVRYSELISPIIKAVQELYRRVLGVEREIASVKADAQHDQVAKDQEIERLKKENVEIKARLEKIEKLLNSK